MPQLEMLQERTKGDLAFFSVLFFLIEHFTTVEEMKLQWGKDWTASDRNTHTVLFVSVETAMQTFYNK